jgi:hypothetical protein
VRIDFDGDRLVAGRGVGHLQPEEHGAAAIGRDVGALQLQPAGVGEGVARVAIAAGELGRRSDPLVADAEPDSVDELQRRAPHAAHLAGGVPAVGVEAAVLEADGIGALPGRHLAAVLQPAGHGQLGGRGLRRG